MIRRKMCDSSVFWWLQHIRYCTEKYDDPVDPGQPEKLLFSRQNQRKRHCIFFDAKEAHLPQLWKESDESDDEVVSGDLGDIYEQLWYGDKNSDQESECADPKSDPESSSDEEEPIYENIPYRSKDQTPIDETSNIYEEIWNFKTALRLKHAQICRISFDFNESAEELSVTPIEVDVFGTDVPGDVMLWKNELRFDYSSEDDCEEFPKEILKTLEAVSDGNGNQKTSNRFPVSPTLEEPELRSSGQRPPRSHTIQILYGGTPKLSPNLPKPPKCDECSGTYEKVLKITGHGIDKKLPKGSLIKIDGGRIIIDEKGKREVLRENIQFESKRLEGKKFIVLVDSEKNHYQLQFDKEKDARQCLPPERTYIRDILRKLLRKRSSKDVLERKGIIRKEPIFGNTLKNLQDKFGTAIPKFVSDSIRLIEMPENITSQFLYRASGNLAIIQKIRFEVDRDKLDILNEYSKDVDVLTGALKLFFRELSDPLITHDIYSELIKLIGEECCAISTKVIKLLSRLPESHRETLLAIVNHLIKVERYKDDNKMDLYNLSVVWGPSLIWFPDKTLNENVLKTSSDAVKVMEMILNVYKGCPSPMLQKRIDSPMTPKLPYKFKSSSESLSSSTIHTERSDNLSHTDSFRENTSQSDESVNSTEVCYRSAMSKGVFGNSLENLEKISKEPLPEFVKRMVELIDSNIGCVGLYRQSGEKTKIDKIKAKIKKNKFSSLDKYSKDTMELACLLKHFFMELGTPLIPRAILDAFIKNFDLDEQDRRKLLLDDINSLPESHKTTLRFLLDHFSRVIDNKQNLMGKEAMCIVWAPVLCSIHNNDCDAAAVRADKAAKLIEMLMDHYAPEEASKLEPMRNKSKSLYDNVRGEASLLDRDSVLLGAERTKL